MNSFGDKPKNIIPSPKGIMGFISFGGGYIFVWGLKPMPGYVPGYHAVCVAPSWE